MDIPKTGVAGMNADLRAANLRLGLIARMAKSNMEETLTPREFVEVMQAILDACGLANSPRN